ncbi:MAG: lysophospholipid acyltransferase family protein [Acidobacteria bacterium]|nr:lysophospholipid acyltransferase family protein [Acidobacteriota bacterium]
MTAVCYVAMGHERRASIANLRQICAEDGLRLRRRSFSLFYNFSRFMVARMEMKNLPEQSITERVVNLPEARAALERALALGSGAVVATAHLGNWEMGVRLLKLSGRKVHIVMMADGVGDIESEYERSRAMEGLKVHWIGEDPFVGAELLSALRDGELVAVQADRNAGAACVTLPLFGAPVQLPLGPATLARAADVPILPCYVLMEDGHHLRLRIDPPIQVRRTSNAREDLYQATLELSRSIEAAVAERPEQWFNFYPIWEKTCTQP